MKATVTDIIQYSFCPKLYEAKGPLPPGPPDLNSELESLTTFIFRRMLETETVPTWRQIQDKWTKIFWQLREESDRSAVVAHNRSQIGLRDLFGWVQALRPSILGVNFSISSSSSRHNVSGSIPGIVSCEDGSVELFYIFPFLKELEIAAIPSVRFLSAIMNQEIPVGKVTVASFSRKGAFRMAHIYPDGPFWEAASTEMAGILGSMHAGLTYRNTAGCRGCMIEDECLATFGR